MNAKLKALVHAEFEARDRARHEKERGRATLMDDFNALEAQFEALQEQTPRLKRRLAHQSNQGGKPAGSRRSGP